jgi:hypothetical protein
MHLILLLGLLSPAEPANPAAAAPAPAISRIDDAQWQQLEAKFPLVKHLDERGRKNWLARRTEPAVFERELAALERVRADVTKFVLARGLDKEAADEALWLAYALAHKDEKSHNAEPFAAKIVLKSLETSSGVLHIETIPAGCKVFIDGYAVPRLSNHARGRPCGPGGEGRLQAQHRQGERAGRRPA